MDVKLEGEERLAANSDKMTNNHENTVSPLDTAARSEIHEHGIDRINRR